MKSRISASIYFLFHPLALALYTSVLILLFIPDYFEKYKAEIIDSQMLEDNVKIFFHDLDGDGVSEKLISEHNGKLKPPGIIYRNVHGNTIGQWNIRGEYLIKYKLHFGDYDNNGYAEVYCLSLANDSIFLNAKELMLKDGLSISERFICKAGIFNIDQTSIFEIEAKMMNVNNDGYDDFVFVLYGGLSKCPRSTFAYSIHNDTMISSPLSAAGISRNVNLMDLNNDGICEITGFVSAPGNVHDEMPYPDSSSWLMVLSPGDNMDFLFPPIKFDGKSVTTSFFSIKDNKYIAATFIHNRANTNLDHYFLKLFDADGSLIKERKVFFDEYNRLIFINPENAITNKFYLIDKNGNTLIADTLLNMSPLYEQEDEYLEIGNRDNEIIDVDGDMKNEILCWGISKMNRYLVMYRSNLRDCYILNLPECKTFHEWHITLKKDGSDISPTLVLQVGNVVYYIKYGKSNYYFLEYPAYAAAYFIIFLLFWLLQKVQNRLAKRGFELEKQLITQQLAISKNQMEPHFMLNTLNNIGYMFSKEDKDNAQYYFGRFSSLIQHGLAYADKVEISLKEELKFIRDYLILQKKRLDDKLEFLIEADDEIDLKNVKIPHSLIFTFVENAVKHGLQPKTDDRKLEILIKKNKGKIVISVADNGIGRNQSKKLGTTGTGQGLRIVDSIIDGYNKLYGRGISYEILDLTDRDGNGVGTEVRVNDV